ncbi:hypothetical protein R6Q59_024515 [Mikania micrantha]
MNPTSSRYHFLYNENEKMADNAKGTGDDGPNARKRKATATFQFVENQKENGSNSDYDINDIDAPFGPPRGLEVTTSGDVQQSRKANVEDFEGCYTFLTPNGTKV